MRAVVGQQVSVSGAATVGGRIVAGLPDPGEQVRDRAQHIDLAVCQNFNIGSVGQLVHEAQYRTQFQIIRGAACLFKKTASPFTI